MTTTVHHLANYTSWHRWEENDGIMIEEDAYANQKDRTRRVKLLDKQSPNSFYFSVLDSNSDLISLLEFYILESELYSPNFILKKVKEREKLAIEAGNMIINYFFSYYPHLKSIMFDLPDFRLISIKILESLGFKRITNFYKLDLKNEWQKMIILRLGKDMIGP